MFISYSCIFSMGNSGSKLPPDELEHLLKVTNFSAKDLKIWYKSIIEEHSSGRLTESDFVAYNLTSLGHGKRPTDYLHLMFRSFDRKGNDYITFSDLMIYNNMAMYGTRDERLMCSFKLYDQKREGKLTYDDLLLVQKSIDTMNDTFSFHPVDRDTAETRCARYYKLLSKDPASDTVDFEEFKELVTMDTTILLSQL